LLQPVPASQANGALQALDRGLSERAGIPKPRDTSLPNLGKIQLAAVNDSRRHFDTVSGRLRVYVTARWRQTQSDPLLARIALRSDVAGVQEHLLAVATNSASPDETRKSCL